MNEIKDMTMKELKQELVSVQEHIDMFSYGRYELNYREQLEVELDRRENEDI